MTSPEAQRERREWLKAHGICTSCGQRDARPGRVKCQVCADKQKKYNTSKATRKSQKRRRKQRKEMGICRDCGAFVETGKTLCAECLEKARTRAAKFSDVYAVKREERYQERKANGICVVCGKRKAYNGTIRCKKCKEKHNDPVRIAWMSKRIAKANEKERLRLINERSEGR